MAVSGGERPGKELLDRGFGARAALHLIANFLVDPRNGDKDRGLNGGECAGQPVEVSAIGNGRAIAKQSVVEMTSCDVGEGKKGDAGGVGVPVKVAGGVVQVGGDIAVGEHDSLRLAGGARGIDKGCQILRLDREAAQPLSMSTVAAALGILEQRGERRAFAAGISSMTTMCSSWVWLRMEAILSVLCFGRDHGDARAGIDQQFGDLLGRERGIDGHIAAPSTRVAKSTTGHSQRFSANSAMRSPLTMPQEAKAWPRHTHGPRVRGWTRDASSRLHPATESRVPVYWLRSGRQHLLRSRD